MMLEEKYELFRELPFNERLWQFAREKHNDTDTWTGYDDWMVEQICMEYKEKIENTGKLSNRDGVLFRVLAQALLKNRLRYQDIIPLYISYYWDAIKEYFIEAGIVYDIHSLNYEELRTRLEDEENIEKVFTVCGREKVMRAIIDAHYFMSQLK